MGHHHLWEAFAKYSHACGNSDLVGYSHATHNQGTSIVDDVIVRAARAVILKVSGDPLYRISDESTKDRVVVDRRRRGAGGGQIDQ